MTRLLDTPFVDVRGDTLRWTLDPVDRAPLAVHDVRVSDDLLVSLRVLGASHQVLVGRHGPDGRTHTLLCETVACDLVGANTMPAAWSGHDGYAFESSTEHLDPDIFTARVARLVRELDGRSDALVAHFPGLPGAMTALAVDQEPAPLAWRTWHAYPQAGELVSTHTIFHPKRYPEIDDV